MQQVFFFDEGTNKTIILNCETGPSGVHMLFSLSIVIRRLIFSKLTKKQKKCIESLK